MANTSFELPNPLTPLAFFPPDLAYQASVSLYVLVGSAAVLIWDILMNLQRDIKMLKRYKLTLSLVVYFISRFSALAYLLGNAVLQTAPLSHCENVHRLQALYPILIPSTSLLFFFRVRAMYSDNTKVVVFFFLLWLAVIGGSITPIIGVSAMNIGPTDYCINSGLKLYVSAACIVPFVHDTLVFCATSWRLWKNAHITQNIHNNVKVMVLGHHLPSFSRALLKDGQAYYLTTISLNIVTIALFFNTSISVAYRSVIGIPNIVLMNSMACHVYRNIRFGVYKESFTGMDISMSLPRHERSPLSAIVFEKNEDANSLGASVTRNDRDTSTLGIELDQVSKTSSSWEKGVRKPGQLMSDVPPV
ncbi:hypothetical protein CPC08DRAFT_698243 [Agrocybe pediades]|nr:hypothetical protein CPC08DRAFT_698243 [Agrocybe pediades]